MKYSNLKTKIFPEDNQSLWRNLVIISGIIHLLAVIFSEGYHRPDEHLGVLNMMLYKLNIIPVEDLSWEFPVKIRSWFQPALYWIIAKAYYFTSFKNPFNLALILRLFSSLIGFFSLIQLSKIFIQEFEKTKYYRLGLGFLLLNPFLPFFHARTSTENLATSFAILGLFYLFQGGASKIETKSKFNFILISALMFSFSFTTRFQMGVMVAAILFWGLYSKSINGKVFCLVVSGIILFYIPQLALDSWGHGSWSYTPWNYLYQNIVLGKAKEFGVDPWYTYLTKSILRGYPPLSLLYVIPSLWMFWKYPKNLWTWTMAPFLIIHSIIAHKEIRFIFPMLPFVAFPLTIFLNDYEGTIQKIKTKFPRLSSTIFKIIFTQGVIILFVSSLKPAFSPISYYRFLYGLPETPKEIITLGVFRDQLRLYVKHPIKEIPIEDRNLISEFLNNQPGPLWFLTDKISDKLIFDGFSSDTSLKKCELRFSSYPLWILNLMQKYRPKDKTWLLFYCQ